MKWFKSVKISETAFNQIKSLPDDLQLKYFHAICEYGINGVEPDFSGIEKSVWIPMKDLIDYNNERSKIYSENGKKGGAPTGNKNSVLIEPLTEAINKSMPKDIKLDNETVRDFLNCGIELKWLESPYSFLDMVIERITDKYGDKPVSEQKTLFITAVKSWNDLREEYPNWKLKKETSNKKKEEVKKIDNAKNKLPTRCICGSVDLVEGFESFKCKKCGAVCEFHNLKWEWKK